MVCGQAHPQNNRPKTTVNKAINTIKMSIPNPKIKKSWAQNIEPNKINFFSETLKRNNGSPLYLINGTVKKTIRYNQVRYVLRLKYFPKGLVGNIQALSPSLFIVAILSLKDSFCLSDCLF